MEISCWGYANASVQKIHSEQGWSTSNEDRGPDYRFGRLVLHSSPKPTHCSANLDMHDEIYDLGSRFVAEEVNLQVVS